MPTLALVTSIVVGIILLPFIVSGLTICAPKWYREHVAPIASRAPGPLGKPVPEAPNWIATPVSLLAIKGFIFMVLAPLALLGGLIWIWVGHSIAIVQQRCPYGRKAVSNETRNFIDEGYDLLELARDGFLLRLPPSIT